jgi:asparagine synthase (glutamine-hydrolysing)
VTVALSGDGGDELFFGYPRYVHHQDLMWVLNLPSPVLDLARTAATRFAARRARRIADVLSDRDTDAYSRFVGWFRPEEIAELTGDRPSPPPLYADIVARGEHVPPALRPLVLDLVSYLPDDILAKVDRASMAVSLEVRAPLLDHRVVEFVLGLPLAMRRRGGTTKWLMRQMLYKRVPRELIERPKMGFGVPLGDWMRGPLRERMDDYCRSDALEDIGLNPEPVRRMWREFGEGRDHRPDLLWQAYVLMAWARTFRSIST